LVIHIAQANYILGSRLNGLKPDIDPTTLAKLSSKDEIVAALETSFAFDHKAIGTITNANAFESVGGRAPSGATILSTRRTQAAYIAVHASDEYGQMVEYQRMNGITPPASGAPAPPQKQVSLDSTMQTGKEEYQHAQPSSELFGGCLSRSERIRDCEATSVQIGPFAQASPTLWRPFHIVGLSHPFGIQAHGDYAPIR
jgi:hypothetical protein